MSSNARRSTRLWLVGGVLVIAGFATGLRWLWQDTGIPATRQLIELTQRELSLRDGKLYSANAKTPFTGRLYENYPISESVHEPLPSSVKGRASKKNPLSVRKLEIEIRDGKANGRSVGRYENGQIEVEEFFVAGVSHGLRTRWDEAGKKKSEEQIDHGKVNGRQVAWHDNGSKALEMTLRDGQPEGVAEAWYPDGQLKSRTHFAAGKILDREFFSDGPAAAATSENEEPSE